MLNLCEEKWMRFPGPTVRFDQSTEYCSTAKPIRVGWCMSYSLKVHNIGYILLKQTPLKTPEILKERFAVVSLQTKKLAIVIKEIRNEAIGRVFCKFRGNYTLERSVLKKINVKIPTTIK